MLGRLAGAEDLGVYGLAYNLAVTIPVGIVVGIATGPMISAYAQMRVNAFDRIEGAVDRVIAGGSTLLVLIFIPMALFANELIMVFYGPKWSAAIPLLQILTLTGMMRGLANLLSPLSIGMNRPEMEAKAKTIEGLLFLLLLYPLIEKYGSSGAAWAGTVIYALAFAIRLRYARQLVLRSIRQPLLTLFAVAVAAIAGGVIGALCSSFIQTDVWRMIVGGAITIGAISGFLILFIPVIRQEVRLGLRIISSRLHS
jgi:O-antigen/teichoic acid export membrane protein